MRKKLQIEGKDIPIAALRPLRQRNINLETNKGFRKILTSIQSVGLIEPLSVFEEQDGYTILDGFLRFKACEQLGVREVPCLIYRNKEAYTFNKMVNRLSPYQEMKMLRKSLEAIDESTIAHVFGLQSIRYRLAPTLLHDLHPEIVRAFEDNEIGRTTAREIAYVLPSRQLEILKEMRFVNDFSPTFVRGLVVRTPFELRNPKRRQRKTWSEDTARKNELVTRLEDAEKQHSFYVKLYRQYSTDLLKLSFYVRKIVTTPKLLAYLEEHHPDILRQFRSIVLETDNSTAKEMASVG
ncbi:MAG TPA: ParB N-terminal domain-containing protein [Kiritimatiellia bacterium]|nr:ParB N-terminal domain-containing protein [Kiritimatiellia bacterium]